MLSILGNREERVNCDKFTMVVGGGRKRCLEFRLFIGSRGFLDYFPDRDRFDIILDSWKPRESTLSFFKLRNFHEENSSHSYILYTVWIYFDRIFLEWRILEKSRNIYIILENSPIRI